MLLLPTLCANSAAAAATPKNVLLLIVDDLRPDLHSFNESFMITPNIDQLKRSGVTFQRAYCQQAICGPTRNSSAAATAKSGSRAREGRQLVV